MADTDQTSIMPCLSTPCTLILMLAFVTGATGFLSGVGEGLFDERGVFGHLRGLEQQAGVRGGVARLILPDAVEIPRIGDDDAELL